MFFKNYYGKLSMYLYTRYTQFKKVFLLSFIFSFPFFSNAEIKIGVGVPLTGANAAFGLQVKQGAQTAVDEINQNGGINSEKIQLFIADDASDPKQAVSVANKFVADGVKFVVGHYTSSSTIPASDVYQESNVMIIAPSATNPLLTERDSWGVFRVCGRDDQQAQVAAEYVKNNFKDKRIAIIHDKSTYGFGLASEFRKALQEHGLKEVLLEGINPGEKDYNAVLSKIKNSKIDFIYFNGYHTEGGLLIRQMVDQGLKSITFMVPDTHITDDFTSISGEEVIGTLMTAPLDPSKKESAAKQVNILKDKNIPLDLYTLYSYAAVEVIKEGIEGAKSTDPVTVAKYIKSGVPIKTLMGTLEYNNKGDVKNPAYLVYSWEKDTNQGKLVYVEK